MKKNIFDVRLNFKKFCFLFILFGILFFQINFQSVMALPLEKNQSDYITEELRLSVPSNYKEVWLKAEKNIWDPWLSSKDGFLGRQIFWNKENEQALILVKWKNKKLWKNVKPQEVNKIQEKFEQNVKVALNLDENPFKLIYDGELTKQE